MWLSFVTGVLLCCSLIARLVDAQGVGASGGLRGVVADPTGARVPKGAVTATDTQRGTKLSAITDTSGQYRLSELTPGPYDVEVEACGFGLIVQKKVTVSVG